MKFAFIEEHLRSFAIATVCWVLDVSRSGYYAWVARPDSVRAGRRRELAVKIRAIHQEHRQVYGSPRVYQALEARGERVCENTVAAVMAGHMKADLVSDALAMAIARRQLGEGLLHHHSDRGVQYASDAYQHPLQRH